MRRKKTLWPLLGILVVLCGLIYWGMPKAQPVSLPPLPLPTATTSPAALSETSTNATSTPLQTTTTHPTPASRIVWHRDKDALVSTTSESSLTATTTNVATSSTFFIRVIGGCTYDFSGDACVRVKAEPSIHAQTILRLRKGIMLRVEETPIENDDMLWYRVIHETTLRYPERIESEWYVAADPKTISFFSDPGALDISRTTGTSTKEIFIDLSEQTLSAYDEHGLFLKVLISTGAELTPTPEGSFSILRKTPSRYMQGPIPGVTDQEYDMPGVPWNLYFTQDGSVIHGAYWHDKFGHVWSHGCVNVPLDAAEILYRWAELGMTVTIHM